jgi:hypothetical protein
MNKKFTLIFIGILLVGASAIAITAPQVVQSLSSKIATIISPSNASNAAEKPMKAESEAKTNAPAKTFEKIDLAIFANMLTQEEIDAIRTKNEVGWMNECKMLANDRMVAKYHSDNK